MKKITRREFEIKTRAYEKGQIAGWRHIVSICKSCIKAHKERRLKPKEFKEFIERNHYLWED